MPAPFWYPIRDVLVMAERRKLTVYNATYLELALRREAPLATLDQALLAAARKEGATLFTAGK